MDRKASPRTPGSEGLTSTLDRLARGVARLEANVSTLEADGRRKLDELAEARREIERLRALNETVDRRLQDAIGRLRSALGENGG